MRCFTFIAFWAALVCVLPSVFASNVLVLVDTLVTRETHSKLLNSLSAQGHTVTVKAADDINLQLVKYGKHLYEHVLILAPGVEEFGGGLGVESFVEYVDNGGNLLVAANEEAGDAIRELATEFGVELDAEGALALDHFNFDEYLDNGTHSTLILSKEQLLSGAELITGSASKPIIYQGAALFSSKLNPLLQKVLVAPSTAYSAVPEKPLSERPNTIGSEAILVAAVQTRNNARVLITGSLSLLSDKFWEKEVKSANGQKDVSGNGQFVNSLTRWLFKEQGQLRVVDVKHHRVGEKNAPESYTILDEVEYSIQVQELVNGVWQPFSGKDVQLEFVRIDSFVRIFLQKKGDWYVARFKLPDVYGVFKFVVDYKRVGYTYLYSSVQVSVRPLEHTQYERFIGSAFPYYASAFSMMFGVFVFSFVFLYHKDESPKQKSQ